MKLLTLVLSVISSMATADHNFSHVNCAYQQDLIIGSWKTLQLPYKYSDMLVTQVFPDLQEVKMVECDPTDLEVNQRCSHTHDYSARGDCGPDGIQMTEGPGSRDPFFTLKIDESNPNKLTRTWHDELIEYFRVN
jgi:hypothetical protein